MKSLAKYSVQKPITIFMTMLIVIVLGIVSLTKLPLELFPNINLPYAVIVTTYEGKNIEEVEKDVTIPIEQNLLTVSNLINIQSTTRDNFSIVFAEFQQSTNMDTAFLEMRENFEMLEFKEGVGNPMIIKFDPDMMPLMVVSLTREWGEEISDDESLIKTTEWVQEDVLNQLERIPGVASVNLMGAADTEIQINLDQEALQEYNLTQEEVLDIVQSQNIAGLAGVVPDENSIRMLYIGDKIIGLDGLKETPITFKDNKVITLEELSTDIKFVNAAQNQYMKINGKQGLAISFQKQSDYGITEAVEQIQNTLNEIVNNDEYNAEYVELLNQGEYIEQSVGSVTTNLIIGSILAIIILFFFLRDIRPTLIVGLAIPISVIGAFALMYVFNVSLNIVSMGGLALGIGMLVDNSIVVIENIYRLLNEGKSPKEAAIQGAGQVAAAITASTITTIAVFLPIVFIEGLTAEIFTAMALTVTFSLIASLIIALTLAPSISSRTFSKKRIKEDKITKKLQSWYEGVARFVLRKKTITLIIITILLFLSGFLASRQGFELIPQTDEGTVNIDVNMEDGTTFDQTAALTDALVEEVMELEDFETVSAQIGSSGMFAMFGGSGSTDQATITVLLKDNRTLSTADIAQKINQMTDELDYEEISNVSRENVKKITVNAQSTTSMSGFGGTGIQIEIKGNNLDVMRELSIEHLVPILESVEGTQDVNSGVEEEGFVVNIKVNKENAIMRGVTEADIKQSITNFYTAMGFTARQVVDTSLLIQVDGVDYKINVPSQEFSDMQMTYEDFLGFIPVFDHQVTQAITKKFDEDKAFPLFKDGMINPQIRYDDSQNRVYIGTETDTNPNLLMLIKGTVYEENSLVPMTTITKDPGLGSINRDGKSRVITVSSKIENDYNISQVSAKVEDKVYKYLNSEEFEAKFGDYGIKVTFVGENQDIQQTTSDMSLAAIAAILIVYMIMAIQFQSLKYPFIVIFTIPLAFTGGFFALSIAGLPISMVAMVGLVILAGIVVNNGIVLIDYLNQLREEGMPLEEAIIEAGKTRLRPILMTALTTSLALIPMAIGFGEGGELLMPLGITAIGGLVYATILTLIVIPVMYRILNRKG